MNKVKVFLLGLAFAGFGCDSTSTSGGVGTQDVSIRFAAMVGEAEFVCGDTYEGLGSDDSSLTLSDFRFYVQDVELKDASDTWVSVTLAQNDFQIDDVALLDFEDRCAGNEAGNPELNDLVLGSVPEGEYDGLRFEMGVPVDLNHADASTAPGALGVVAMFWTWRGGYKFLRVDSGSFSPTDWRMHLGSTGCGMGDPNTPPEQPCTNSNRVDVVFDTFDTETNRVIADFEALVDGAAIGTNQDGTPVGCMSGLDDPDCATIFGNLGLAFDNSAAGLQQFFSAE